MTPLLEIKSISEELLDNTTSESCFFLAVQFLTMEEVYEQFQNYDFDQSPSYKKTLEQVYNQYLIVLSDKDLEVKQDIANGVFNPDRIPQADREQLQLQTKIFVFCSETDNILEIQDYQYWLEKNSASKKIEELPTTEAAKPNTVSNQSSDLNTDISVGDVPESANPEEYTSNYQELVDMIVNNKPIPGIKQIPKTILDPSTASSSSLEQRRKPWERAETKTQETVEDTV